MDYILYELTYMTAGSGYFSSVVVKVMGDAEEVDPLDICAWFENDYKVGMGVQVVGINEVAGIKPSQSLIVFDI